MAIGTTLQDQVLGIVTNSCKTKISVLQQYKAYFTTRQLSYRKEDRAMRPIYRCHEKF